MIPMSLDLLLIQLRKMQRQLKMTVRERRDDSMCDKRFKDHSLDATPEELRIAESLGLTVSEVRQARS